jgi:hypothetical protein
VVCEELGNILCTMISVMVHVSGNNRSGVFLKNWSDNVIPLTM